MQYGFVIDHRKCIGCHACTVACKAENDVPVGSFRTWVKYTEIGTFPKVKRHFAVLRCNQCTSAPCVTICPVNALEKRADGIVDLDKDACIGCKACIQACPYDAIYLNDETGGAEKCHFCAHRVEQGLQPACAVVCPEEAIIAGDLHDPASKVSKLAAMAGATVRRPEQGTGPNVFYLGVDPVSLHPGRAAEPSTYLWSERRVPPPDWPADHAERFEVHPEARTVLDVGHDVMWGTPVAAYLVTKGLAAGAALLAPLLVLLGATGFAADFAPEVLALSFTLATVVILIADLKRPMKFFRLLTRPNTRSWLVKGGWVLGAFAAATAAILVLALLGERELAATLRWPNLLLGAMAAIYTAFLFAQCEGRDLWQDVGHLVPHLLVQAVLLGAAALLPFLVPGSTPALGVGITLAVSALLHGVFARGELRRPRDTENARQAAALLTRIPVVPGGTRSAFELGVLLTNGAAGLAGVALAVGALGAPIALVLLLMTSAGLFLYEHAFVRAAQIPPLS